MDSSSSLFWKVLSSEPVLAAVEAEWREWLGDDLGILGALLRPEAAPALAYPCTVACGRGCQRRVVSHGEDDLVAVCDEADVGAPPLRLTWEELRVFRLDLARLASMIASALGFKGETGPVEGVFGALSLGWRSEGHGQRTPVYLVFSDFFKAIPKLLLRAREAQLLIPSLFGFPEEVAALLSIFGVQWSSCEDLLELDPGRGFVPRPAEARDEDEEAAVCRLLSEGGQELLTQERYNRLVAEVSGVDLFLDLTTTVDSGRYRAGRRGEDGCFEERFVSRNQAAAIAELIERRAALRPAALRSIATVQRPAKVVEQARQAVDLRLSRFRWRSIHTIAGAVPEAKRFLFQPPAGLRFAVLTPL